MDGVLDHVNSVRPMQHKFTMELEEGRSIPFLDTRITRKVEGKLDIIVYRKSTYRDRYLHFNSHHPTHANKGLVRCLYMTASRRRNKPADGESPPHRGPTSTACLFVSYSAELLVHRLERFSDYLQLKSSGFNRTEGYLDITLSFCFHGFKQ